jgi:hypothetical protein
MILFLDYRNSGRRIGLIERRTVRFSRPSVLGRVKKPSAVVVGVHVPGAARLSSWSTMRAAVAEANALAFAWNVPVAEVAVRGDESDHELVAAAREAGSGQRAAGKRWALPRYGGEPTITSPKA